MNIIKKLQSIMDLEDYDKRLKEFNRLGRAVGVSVMRLEGEKNGGTDEEVMISRIHKAIPLYQASNAFKVSVVSLIIAALGALAACGAIWQSSLARNDTRILNKLDLRPILSIRSRLQENTNFPTHILIQNNGPVDAIQLQVSISILKYFPKIEKVRLVMTSSDLQWTIDKLPPLKKHAIKVNLGVIDSMLPAFEHKEYRILEIRLLYRREVDAREYSESSFYFVSPEGKWVSERSSALDSKVYEPIKKAAFQRFSAQLDMIDISDPLHDSFI